MRPSLKLLSKEFGNLAVIRGTVKYHVSPMEQRAFAGAISQGVPNIFWRMRQSFFYVMPSVLLTYLVYYTAEKEHDRLQRKQPGQFDHEK